MAEVAPGARGFIQAGKPDICVATVAAQQTELVLDTPEASGKRNH